MGKRLIAILFFVTLGMMATWAQTADEGYETWTGGERWPETRTTAREEPAPLVSETYPNALGFSFGTDISPISLFNLHYQGWIGDIGVAVNLGAMKGMFSDPNSWSLDVLGSFQYKVSDGNLIPSGNVYGALYVFFQTGYVGMHSGTYDTVTLAYTPTWTDYFPIGVGIGIEGVLFKRFSIPLEVGFKYNAFDEPVYFGPTFTTAIRYRF